MKQAYLPLGEIVAAHGIRGEVRVNPNTDNPELLYTPGTLYLDAEGKQSFRLLHGAPHKNIYLIQIEGITTPEEATALRGKTVYAPRKAFHLGKNEHFIADLLGMRVVDDRTDEEYGVLNQVLDQTAQLLYEIRRADGSLWYLPAVAEFVKAISDEKEEIRVTPPEGLFDA